MKEEIKFTGSEIKYSFYDFETEKQYDFSNLDKALKEINETGAFNHEKKRRNKITGRDAGQVASR